MLPVSAAFAHGDWNPTDKDAAMTSHQDNKQTDTPQGKLLRLGKQREIAIYSYAGTAWVCAFLPNSSNKSRFLGSSQAQIGGTIPIGIYKYRAVGVARVNRP